MDLHAYRTRVHCVSVVFVLLSLDPDDYLGSTTEKTIVAGQLMVCVTYNIHIDEAVEQNEDFIVTITKFRPQRNSAISLGQQSSTTVTILDGGKENTYCRFIIFFWSNR